MKVGLIGAGAIGRQIMASLGLRHGVETVLLLRPGGMRPKGVPVVTAGTLADFLAHSPDVVIEAARQEAVAELLPPVLERGIPVILCSTGALADQALRERLAALARSAGTEIILPGGAVGGVDYLRSVSGVAGTRVVYVSRKPPAAWRDELAQRGYSAEDLTSPIVLFEGAPEAAARFYPRNLNSALTIALAASPAATTVRVMADPAAAGNCHEIEVTGPAGTARMAFLNAPTPDNPKTSALTPLSVLRALDEMTSRHGMRHV